jgi:hypothetical protein
MIIPVEMESGDPKPLDDDNKCVYCSIEVDSRDYLMNNGCEGIYIDGNGNLVADDELQLSDVKIKFCPICGKKLR